FGRAVQAVKRRLAPAPAPAAAEKRYDDEADIRHIIRRYLENKRLTEGVCREYGVVPSFAWQPVPTYKYDLRWHPFAGQGFFSHTRSQHGYPAMAAAVRATPPGGHFLWLADMQEHAREALYVDPGALLGQVQPGAGRGSRSPAPGGGRL